MKACCSKSKRMESQYTRNKPQRQKQINQELEGIDRQVETLEAKRQAINSSDQANWAVVAKKDPRNFL